MSRFKMLTKIFVLAFSALAIFFFFTNKRLTQLEPMRVLELLGIIQNSLKVSTDFGFDDLQISWVGFIKSDKRYDTLVIYENGKELQKIPNAYGKTFLIVTTDNSQGNKIGIWKFKPWYKHNYELTLSHRDGNALIEWQIKNIYETVEGEESTKR